MIGWQIPFFVACRSRASLFHTFGWHGQKFIKRGGLWTGDAWADDATG
jgi:hypothetical protein